MAKTALKISFLALLLLLITIWAEIAKSPEDNNIHLYFFDVGQGDAALIEKNNQQILIDGGPSEAILEQLSLRMPVYDKTIETVVLSHPHADHLAGLLLVLDRYKVEKIYFTGVAHTSNQYMEFLEKIKNKNINAEVPDINQNLEVFQDATLTFLWPGKEFSQNSAENLNDTSLVSKFCYLSRCALFMGDLELEGQSEMFEKNQSADFGAEILKVAHHGSSNGTDANLLERVKPKYAIINAGADNQYGHPHRAVLDLLSTYNIQTLRTDRDGSLEFIFDESGVHKN